jgi:hypothetical protein
VSIEQADQRLQCVSIGEKPPSLRVGALGALFMVGAVANTSTTRWQPCFRLPNDLSRCARSRASTALRAFEVNRAPQGFAIFPLTAHPSPSESACATDLS